MPNDLVDPKAWARTAFLNEKSEWDFNEGGHAHLSKYLQALLKGIKVSAKKPTNMEKTTEIIYKTDEPLGKFYERPCKTYQIYTPFDPESSKSQQHCLCCPMGPCLQE